jgi:hypothetical protein
VINEDFFKLTTFDSGVLTFEFKLNRDFRVGATLVVFGIEEVDTRFLIDPMYLYENRFYKL